MRISCLIVLLLSACVPLGDLTAADKVPPYDLWTPQVLAKIRDRSTLNYELTARSGYADVLYTSNPSAGWYDATPPYEMRTNGKIQIHGFLAAPASGGPYPALVIGHGHGGQADLSLARQIAAFGYVALAIDGPMAGQSSGGPKDENQAWISVDTGPEYGYLYHYAYAGMRGLTLLEELSGIPGNPYRIDASRLGVLGASMGGILTSIVNGIDDRVKAAVVLAAAGQWQHSMRFPKSWLYHGLYTGTRDQPYDGKDPLNSIEDIETDPTAITFMNYFDPIRYAPRQHAPVLVVVGTHDGYFPLTCANQMALGIMSAGTRADFEKRLWLFPNARHGLLDNPLQLFQLVTPLLQWLDYSFGKREKPLASPQVAMTQDASGLRFEITLGEPSARLAGAGASLYAATRVDANVPSIQDFKRYTCSLQGDRFVALISAGDRPATGDAYTVGNIIYFATVTDARQLPVSSLVYKAGRIIDLSSGFVPGIDPYEASSVVVPVPPAHADAVTSVASSRPVPGGAAYQGMSLANPADSPVAVRMEARTEEGRLAARDGLINPVFMTIAPRSQRIFLAEEWMGSGARQLAGAFRFGWSDVRASSLAFRGIVAPAELSEIGPLPASGASLWLPLLLEQDPAALRTIRVFAGAAAAGVTIDFRNGSGTIVATRTADVPSGGSVDLQPPQGGVPALAEIRSSVPVSARLEVNGTGDPWSIEARAVPAAGACVQPHVEWNGIFKTRLLIVNPSPEPRTAVLRLRTAAGERAVPDVTLPLAAYSLISQTVEALAGVQSSIPAGAGWLEVDGSGSPLLVTALAADPAGRAAAASALLSGGAGVWSMPFFVENAGYWTGLAILNPGETPLSMDLTAYDASGFLLARVPLNLQAREGHTRLVSQWIPSLPAESTGQIVVSATGNVSLLAYFGTDDGASLAAIPFSLVPR